MAQATTHVLGSRLYSTIGKRAGATPGQGGPQSRAADSHTITFAGGLPDPKSLPAKSIAEATARAMEKNGEWALQYGSSQGYPGVD